MVASVPLPDQVARRTALLDHTQCYLVEAGAGSGKTALLAGRVVVLLAAGVLAAEIVAITFTEAAASELRERIERYLHILSGGEYIPPEVQLAFPDGVSSEQKAAIANAQNTIDEITCTTIHGFCQKLIKPYPVELSIDPGARILDEPSARLLRDELLPVWFNTIFADTADDTTMLCTFIRRAGVSGLGILHELGERIATLAHVHIEPVQPFPQEVVHELHECIGALRDWYQGVPIGLDYASNVVAALSHLSDEWAKLELQNLSYDTLLTLLLHDPPICVKKNQPPYFTKWQKKTAWGQAAQTLGASQNEGKQYSDRFLEYYERCAHAYLNVMQAVAEAVRLRILDEFRSYLGAYQEKKRQTAVLDFDDLLAHARKLVVEHAHIRKALSRKFRCILVDEFQDTDPLQAEILWYLCGEGSEEVAWHQRKLRPGSLFLVGDPKQAIYGFRGADLATYQKAKQALISDHPDGMLEISANFRSSTAVIECINTTFAPLLAAERFQPGFVALHSMRPASGEQSSPAVVAVDLHFEEQHFGVRGRLQTEAARSQEAQGIAAAVEGFIGEYPVWNARRATFRPCRAEDIALLAPKGTALWVYERAFHERGIPIVSQAGKGFFQRQEIHDLIAVMRTLCTPTDTLALGAFLRGPLIGFTEHELADEIHALAQRAGDDHVTLSMLTPLEDLRHPLLRQTMEHLHQLRLLIHCRTPFAVITELLERFHVRSLVRARDHRGAERSLSNIDQFLEIARTYDARGTVEFTWTMAEKWQDATREPDAVPDLQAGAVALVTMHHAKGLEWPIVIPVNCCSARIASAAPILQNPLDRTVHFAVHGYSGCRYDELKVEQQARADQEAIRLWYVACTRARDLIVLPRQVLPDSMKAIEGDWLSLLELPLATLPEIVQWKTSYSSQASTAQYRPFEISAGINTQSYAVWQAEQSLIKAGVRSVHNLAPSRHHETLREPDGEHLFSFETGTEHTPPQADFQGIRGSRERGILLHILLEEVLLGALEDTASCLESRVCELLEELGNDAGSGDKHRPSPTEIALTVQRALTHPEIMPLRDRLVPEISIYASAEDKDRFTIIDGIVDAMVFAPDGSIEVVIDWKSDVQPNSDQSAEYRAQMTHYLTATAARRGLIVYLTSGEVEAVEQICR